MWWSKKTNSRPAFLPGGQPRHPRGKRTTEQERKIIGLIGHLFHFNLDWFSHAILTGIRKDRHNQPIPVEHEPRAEDISPAGPFATLRHKQRADLLLFVPRRLESYIIDDLTGAYGYSHLAVDCGEVDLPTRKAVMIESTVGKTVKRKFLNEYGQRHYIRVPLAKVGVDPVEFCECVKSKLGQPYDNLEALTWGSIDDPAKQVCSDLATICLPEKLRADIARTRRLGMMRRFSVSLHLFRNAQGIREFISPNGFAEYFGVPKGKTIREPGQVVEPHPIQPSLGRFLRRNYVTLALLAAALMAVFIVSRQDNTLK